MTLSTILFRLVAGAAYAVLTAIIWIVLGTSAPIIPIAVTAGFGFFAGAGGWWEPEHDRRYR